MTRKHKTGSREQETGSWKQEVESSFPLSLLSYFRNCEKHKNSSLSTEVTYRILLRELANASASRRDWLNS